MDDHQRRVWARMVEAIDSYSLGRIDLPSLGQSLQGLLAASDLLDEALVDEFWHHFAPIDAELELRTEEWAPAGAASDSELREALDRYKDWVARVLASSGPDRT